MDNNKNETRFLMVDRIVEYQGKYLIYVFGNSEMDETLRERKIHEYHRINDTFSDARVIAVKQSKSDNSFLITDNNGLRKVKMTFNEYQKIFNDENNSFNPTPSKPLGEKKESNDDKFVTSFLTKITGKDFIGDDEGVKITEELLGQNNTHGFDLDVFDSKSKIVYEFLRRKSPSVDNLTAHPMRYAWNSSNIDNRRKFISLWHFCQHFDLKLVFISYSTSDEVDNNIVKLIIPELIDDDKGFQKDTEYCLNKEELFLLVQAPNPIQTLNNNPFPSICLTAQDLNNNNNKFNFKSKLQKWRDSLLKNHRYY